jgi:hypothetical protein
MTQSLWIDWPRKAVGDDILDNLPARTPQAAPEELAVELRIFLTMPDPKSTTQAAQEIGSTLDRIVDVLKNAPAKKLQLIAWWECQ